MEDDPPGPPVEVANQIRGMYPWPGCRVRLLDRDGSETARVTLVRARAVAAEPSNTTSDIGIGGVEIIELQPQGKRPMTLASFKNGHRWEAGTRVESIA